MVYAAEEPVDTDLVLPGGMGLIKDAFTALHPWLFRPRFSLSAHGVARLLYLDALCSRFSARLSVFACALCGRRPFDGGCLSSSTLTSLRFYRRFWNERTNERARIPAGFPLNSDLLRFIPDLFRGFRNLRSDVMSTCAASLSVSSSSSRSLLPLSSNRVHDFRRNEIPSLPLHPLTSFFLSPVFRK